jgi:hypothetical protein
MVESLLRYRDYRYLWLGLGLSAAAVALYLTQGGDAPQPPNGGSWQGYVLGGTGALLVVWLSFLGIRKRRYRSRLGTVQGWTSAHVYLGLSLLVIATLHCAAQFGINVHTLAYLLLLGVVLSGIFGTWAYTALPRRVADNDAGRAIALAAEELTALDREILRLAARCDAELQALVASAVELTGASRGTLARLRRRDGSRLRLADGRTAPNRDQQAVLDHLAAAVPAASRRREAQVLGELLDAFGRRQVLLRRLREDARLAVLLKGWLFLHVPLTAALLAALVVHIITVFLYW